MVLNLGYVCFKDLKSLHLKIETTYFPGLWTENVLRLNM